MASKFKVYVVRPVRDRIIYLFFRSMLVVGQFVPRRLQLWWHGLLARPAYLLTKNTRKAISRNLTTAFGPEKQKGEYDRMGLRLFQVLTWTITDYALFWKLKTREQFSRYFTFEGEEHLRAAHARGRGVLCLIPHTAGWEFSAIMPPVMGYKTMGVSRSLHNAPLGRLMVDLRESRGMADVIRDNCFNVLVERLKQGECLIIMIDQDSVRVRGEFLKFFGKDAYTPIGCARLVMATGAAVVPMYTLRNDDDTYVFRILPEIPFVEKETELETIRYNTQLHSDAMEQIIRQHPTQWVWMHNRWKTTPESLHQYLEEKRQRQ